MSVKRHWNSWISSSLSNLRNTNDQDLVTKSQWAATESFGCWANLKRCGNWDLKGRSPIHESVQKATLLPFPVLKVFNSITFSHSLEMLIHGLLRLFPDLFRVCQSNVLHPCILLITWHHNTESSFKNLQTHLARRALFL